MTAVTAAILKVSSFTEEETVITEGSKSKISPSPSKDSVMHPKPPKHLLHHQAATSPDDTKKSSNEEFKKLKDNGYKLPTVLEKIINSVSKGWKLLNEGIDKLCDLITSTVGFTLKCVGIGILLAGGIHFMIVLCTIPPASVVAGGLMVVIMALIKTGALPTIIAGATMYKFGKDLMENKSIPSLSFVSWILPTPFYNMLNMDDPTQNPDPSQMPM